jgi:hypothetical protein
MNGAQTSPFAKLRRVAGSVSGPPASLVPFPENVLTEPHRFKQAFFRTKQRKGVQVVVVQHSQNLLPFA